ncbi:MAG: S8 family peptidase, partial [Bacteroidota bacterium]|nr:S8 family peptidase [Bacteroidota bacterium]
PYIGTPADGDSVITVGGVYPSGTYWPASSTGPTADGRIKPDVSAQSSGVGIARLQDSYGSSSGTSFSAPMVAGVIAQILQVNNTLTPREVWSIITSTASQAESPDSLLGWGIINADAAIRVAEQTGLNAENRATPAEFGIIVDAPYPNPFTNSTRFSVEIAEPVFNAHLTIYNLIGQEVARPWSGRLNAGHHDLEFSAEQLPPGMYLYVFRTEHSQAAGTVVLVR